MNKNCTEGRSLYLPSVFNETFVSFCATWYLQIGKIWREKTNGFYKSG